MYPILFEFGFITIFAQWLFIAIGFVVGSHVFIKLSRLYRIRLSLLSQYSLSLFFWTLGISRLIAVLLHPQYYFYKMDFFNILSIFAIWDKIFSFWGAICAWFIGLLYISIKNKEPADSRIKFWDIMMPSILVGMVFGNLGAFLEGINYGIPTNLPWGMVFKSPNVKYITEIHPTQLYGALYAALIAFCLVVVLKKLHGRLPGFATELTIFMFSFFRFFEEFLRGDDTIKIFGIRLPQILALGGIVLGLYLIRRRYQNKIGGDPEHVLKIVLYQVVQKFRKQNSSGSTLETTRLQNQTA
jgi:phosphatidylglycerol:prolipoprotein diacylglycerol transferase